MKRITRERPRIDRIACTWLITRYIDDTPEFPYVPSGDIVRIAAETRATPYYVPSVEVGHHGNRCSFDAFIAKYAIKEAALDKLALIVRAADTGLPELVDEAAGVLAISRGLSMNFVDDHQMLSQGMVIYDALYAICSKAPLTRPSKAWGRQ